MVTILRPIMAVFLRSRFYKPLTAVLKQKDPLPPFFLNTVKIMAVFLLNKGVFPVFRGVFFPVCKGVFSPGSRRVFFPVCGYGCG